MTTTKDTCVFDYEKLFNECGMEVEYITSNGLIGGNCHNPAIYKVWWNRNYNGVEHQDEMFLCEEHFQQVLADEKSNDHN